MHRHRGADPLGGRSAARPPGMSPCQLLWGSCSVSRQLELKFRISSVRTRMQRRTRSTTL
eukprot:9500111-Pyramimonas_sp.AAC.1